MAQNVNSVQESFDVVGAGSPARLAAALSNGEMTVDEYYSALNDYLETNNSVTGDVIFTALFIVPGGGQGGAAAGGAAKKGIKTASGLIVDGFAHPHALNRVIGSPGRLGVKPQAILDALKNPLKINNIVIDDLGRHSQRFVGQFGEVVVNPQTGKIVSVNPTSTKKAQRLMRQLGRK